MPDAQAPHDPLAEIDAQQDELLRQLDELNERLERTLVQFAGDAPKQAKELDSRRVAA